MVEVSSGWRRRKELAESLMLRRWRCTQRRRAGGPSPGADRLNTWRGAWSIQGRGADRTISAAAAPGAERRGTHEPVPAEPVPQHRRGLVGDDHRIAEQQGARAGVAALGYASRPLFGERLSREARAPVPTLPDHSVRATIYKLRPHRALSDGVRPDGRR